MHISLRILSLASTLALIACSDSSTSSSTEPRASTGDCTPAGSALIEVTSPRKGAVLKPGDTVTIEWKTVIADFQGYIPQVSLDGGKAWDTPLDPAVTGSVLADSKGTATQCLSYKTRIPTDGSYTPAGTDNVTVMFRVKDYSSTKSTMRDASDSVTVKAP